MSIPLVAQAAERIRSHFPELTVFEGPSTDRVEGSGSVVVELYDGGPWGRADINARRRVLQVNVLSDRTRDDEGLPLKDDADWRAWDLWLDLDRLFNDGAQDWRHNGWRAVHHSRRSDGPTLSSVPGGDGGVLLVARYEVSHD